MGDGLKKAIADTRATRRTPQQQADDFVKANNRNPVIAGAAIERNPHLPSKGGLYKTDDGKWHRMGVKALQLLPTSYPKWRL